MNAADWLAWAARIEEARHRERGALVAELCRLTGFSRDTVYRRLADAGYESGRRQRSDAGSSSMSKLDLQRAAALLSGAQRKDGRNPMTYKRARGILLDNGIHCVSEGQLGRLLNELGLGKKGLQQAAGFVDMRSLFPNHVHLVDPSLALWYFTPQGGQRIISAEEHYKNKDFFEGRKIENKCWRYVLVDHYSGSICVRYYESAGENMLNLWDFLLYAWGKKQEPLYAFCGVPELMVWDKGSANMSKAMQRALESVGVEMWAHKAGKPQAKGAVETMNRHWEGWLETVLRYEPVGSLEELNALAERYCAGFNANSFENHDSTLLRRGRNLGARLGLWSRIANEQLRLLPDEAVARTLLTREPELREVAGNLCIKYAGYAKKGVRMYSLAGLPGIEVGKKVMCQPLIFTGKDTLRVSWHLPRNMGGQAVSYDIEPVEMDAAGFPASAAVWGEEFRALPETAQQKERKEIEPGLLGDIKTHSAVVERPVLVPELAAGEQIELPQQHLVIAEKGDGKKSLPVRAEVVSGRDIRLSVSQAVARVRSELGYLPEGLAGALRERFPSGMSADELNDYMAGFGQLDVKEA